MLIVYSVGGRWLGYSERAAMVESSINRNSKLKFECSSKRARVSIFGLVSVSTAVVGKVSYTRRKRARVAGEVAKTARQKDARAKLVMVEIARPVLARRRGTSKTMVWSSVAVAGPWGCVWIVHAIKSTLILRVSKIFKHAQVTCPKPHKHDHTTTKH